MESTNKKFVDVPVQARKCHLSNVIPISTEQTEKAIELCDRLIFNQIVTIYIHDNNDLGLFDSIACTLQTPQMQLELSLLLISLDLVQYKTHSIAQNECSPADKFQLEKRLRKKSDNPLRKKSWELVTFDDFKKFYDTSKAELPLMVEVNIPNDDISETFDLFKAPSKRDPFNDIASSDIQTPTAAHPMIDCAIQHFSLMHVTEKEFYCRPVYIVDPITILIEVGDPKPPKISQIEQKTKYFPLEGLLSVY